jgi:hypothetical protein
MDDWDGRDPGESGGLTPPSSDDEREIKRISDSTDPYTEAGIIFQRLVEYRESHGLPIANHPQARARFLDFFLKHHSVPHRSQKQI